MGAAPLPAAATPGTEADTACKYFARGYCKFGESCAYRHGGATITGDRQLEQSSAPSTAAGSDSTTTSAVLNESTCPRLRRGYSDKLIRVQELDRGLEDDSGFFKNRRHTLLKEERQSIVAQMRVDAKVLRARIGHLDERIGLEKAGLLAWFQSDSEETLLHAEMRSVKQSLQELEKAINAVSCDDDDVPDEIVERALNSLEIVPPDTQLWRTVVGFVDERQQQHIQHYGGSRMVVKKLWRVPENAALKAMEQQGMSLGRPTQLFHGTAVETAAKIIRNGFLVPRYHAHGGMFGKGIYFAETPLKSANYTSKEGMLSKFSGWLTGNALSSGGKQMLLCDVYLGRQRTLRLGARPNFNPDKDLKAGVFSQAFSLGDYHSVYVAAGLLTVNVAEWIVYEPSQAIPKYLIEFEREKTQH